jgi:hypothetical protein
MGLMNLKDMGFIGLLSRKDMGLIDLKNVGLILKDTVFTNLKEMGLKNLKVSTCVTGVPLKNIPNSYFMFRLEIETNLKSCRVVFLFCKTMYIGLLQCLELFIIFAKL